MVDQRSAQQRPTVPALPTDASTPIAAAPTQPARIEGLDGLRGLAALYVLLHHCWLFTFHGYPADTGPLWLGWLLYGHLGVVFFLTLSGFCLAIAPAQQGWRLDGTARFARRRAWRVLPPYWAALAFSLVIAWTVTPQPHNPPPDGASVVVYGLMLQDIVGVPTPNGAFWSIAVEAELYVVFPFLLFIRRRFGAVAALAVVLAPVLVIGLHDPNRSTVDRFTWLTQQLTPLFAMGLLAAGVLSAGDRVKRPPWHGLAALAAVPPLLLIVVMGTVWTVHHYFWVDLAIGPAIALLLAAVATRRPAPLVWLLASAPARHLGTFSYSLYLIHLPIVVAVSRRIVAPHIAAGLPAFWVTASVAVPLSLVTARLFAAIFEIPFQRRNQSAN